MRYLAIILSICLLASVSPQNLTSVDNCIWQGAGVTLDLSKLTNYFEYYDAGTLASYRYYPCVATVDWGVYYCLVAEGPALCQQNEGNVIYVVGTLATVTVTALAGDSFELHYEGGEFGREGKVTVTCFQGSDSFKFDSETFPTYYFSLSVKDACSRGGVSPSGDDGGFALFIILILASIIGVTSYIAGGVAFMYFHKKERGLGLVPNLVFWKDFPFLLRDGFLFTFSCIPKVREYFVSKIHTNYEKIPS